MLDSNKENIQRFGKYARKFVGQRQNMTGMLDWIKEDPTSFGQRLDEIDRAIIMFNSVEPLSDELRNIFDIKANFPHIRLPMVARRSFTRQPWEIQRRAGPIEISLREINRYMKKGEAEEKYLKVPYLRFQTRTSDPENLAVGFAFHYLGIHLRRNPFLAREVSSDQLVDGLIEAAIFETPKTRLLEVVGSRERLNWIEGYDEFDPRFRARLGLN